MDIFIDMNSAPAGTAVTTSNLASSTEGTFTNWDLASPAETFAASQVTLNGAVAVNSGPTHTCGFATQSLAFLNETQVTRSRINFSTSNQVITVSGWLVLGPPYQGPSHGGDFDLVHVEGRAGSYAVLQLQSGNDGLECGAVYALNVETGPDVTTHSSCITVNPGGTYFYSMQVDMSSNLMVSWNLYTADSVPFTQVGNSVTVPIAYSGGSDTPTAVQYGNLETGTAPGTYTYFQNSMIDYTNATWPNIPH